MNERRIEYMPLSDLLSRFHPENAKSHALGSIGASLQTQGLKEQPLLDEASGRLAAGHGRLQSLAQLKAAGEAPPEDVQERSGEWYVPVTRGVSFRSAEHLRAYLVTSNSTVIEGGWHEDLLTQALAKIANETPDLLPATGYDEDDIDRRIRKLAQETEQAPAQELYPLAIALTPADHERWQDWKRSCGKKRDTEALLALLDR